VVNQALSVVIVSFRSRENLETCIPSILRQDVPALEILVVDNSPGDGTSTWLTRAYPTVRVITSTNTGYAGGCNLGIRCARSEWILLLNPDTELEPGALGVLLQTAASHPDALITPMLLRPDGRVNACGLELHFTGLASCRGIGQDRDDYSGLHPVPLASGAALMARRSLLLELGGMDEAYFMYMEDVDLSLRARLRACEVLCQAGAVVRHAYALDMSPDKFELLERNRLVTLLKLYRARTLLHLGPALVLTELATWCYAVVRGPRYLLAKLGGYRWLLHHWSTWRAARARVQTTRRVGDRDLLALCNSSLPVAQLIASARLAALIERSSSRAYRLLWLILTGSRA
jgi:GT2 family glycosyltransferase